MATNKYFNQVDRASEQDTFEDLVIEMIQTNGVDIMYIPREDFEMDPILKEPTKTTFRKALPIEVYMPDGGNPSGDQAVMSQLGFRIDNTTELFMSKRRFSELGLDRIRPREGDLIYVGDPWSPYDSFLNALFEIKSVWYNHSEWDFGRHFVYRITAALFRNSYEQFQTGIPALDAMQANNEAEVNAASNNDIIEAKKPLLVFDPCNPLGEY